MPPRFHVDLALLPNAQFALPEGAARHAQVLRLQPGAAITLFDGRGGEWQAEVVAMGRRDVDVRLIAHVDVSRELPFDVELLVGIPTNDRMDSLVEKATELGAARIVPLLCERSVMRLAGERAERRRAHWQGIAVAAAEQCGRTRVPAVDAVQSLPQALALAARAKPAVAWVLSLDASAEAAADSVLRVLNATGPLRILSGPEGGLTEAEEQLAVDGGARRVSLGPRTFRADTAPLAVLAMIAALAARADR